MQIEMTNIRYDDKYIYATGKDLLTGHIKNFKINRTNDKDFEYDGDYETVFFRGACYLACQLKMKKKLPKRVSCMWE